MRFRIVPKKQAAVNEATRHRAPVPEASTTVSLGLLLMLGMGGVVIAGKRKKRA
jgi:hypothetical protein